MRLLFVSHSLPPLDRPLDNLGGMQRVALELDTELAQRGDIAYETRFLRAPWATVHIRSVGFLLRTLPLLRRRARRGDVDVVLFSSMVTAGLMVLLKGAFRRSGVLAAAIVHGLDVTTPSRIYQRFVPRVFDALDLVMPVSEATGQACLERGLDPEKLRPVRNGVDVSRFETPGFLRQERREALNAVTAAEAPEADTLVLASVGRQVRRKGFDWFIRNVMPLLPQNVHYWLAGDGPETPRIVEAVRETGLTDRVELLGRVSEEDLQALYRGADLFVMPNVPVEGDMEGFGVVMLEAGMNGMPTVGSRLEGIAEVIEDGQNGSLVESGDTQAFTQAVMQFHGEPALLDQASERAYDFTRSRFSWKSVAAEYVDVLRERWDRKRRTDDPQAH
ncbi:MAG: glycosyltransferase family 4 protein [Rhodothermales bacterium]|nr:glycosyltransferase family 4 protein [Rhodothermales bacterium]MBO6778860.1 glycosyltransferase family 4 protein [Rhodothermales bacterium]